MFGKWIILGTLMLTAVPAGCIPVLTVGLAVEEVSLRRSPPRGRQPGSVYGALIAGTVGAALSVLAAKLFHRQLRRTRDPAAEFPLGLGPGAFRVLLWAGLLLGAGCGFGMLAGTQI